MKKFLAVMLALLMLLIFATAAFARTWALLEWNEELQGYEITVYEDDSDDMGVCPNPDWQNQNYQDYQNYPPTLPFDTFEPMNFD
ncbi:MAG: hypothetical protein J6T99_11185 [Oscillospiraceae bacterium]|nr:hypothetical protein [Oscillospiraceae bacterium]